jgi:putative FmdB family regulatory protein
MPTYEYKCHHQECVGEFEEFHSIVVKLEECPHCLTAGRGSQPIDRLISGGSGRGIMDQTVAEIKAGMKESVRKIHQRAARDENFAANIIGESKYNKL